MGVCEPRRGEREGSDDKKSADDFGKATGSRGCRLSDWIVTGSANRLESEVKDEKASSSSGEAI